LNSISALTAIDASKAREMCIQLSDFLRQTLGLSEQTNIPLHQELDLVRNYLAIEKVRFGTRFKLEEHIPEQCLEDTVPPLILQPLVENAIVHGIAGVIDAGLLVLEADHTEENKLRLVVENSFDPESRPMREAGFGIPGIRKRLYVIYGKEASLKIVTGENRFRVEVLLPRS
jgi:LytS/YehU family sensor histidine kinase